MSKTLAIPNTLNNFLENLNISRDPIKFKESSTKIIETDEIPLNSDIIQSKTHFLDYFPWLQMEKLGVYRGVVGVANSDLEVLMKIKIKEEKNVVFKAMYKGNNDDLVRFLLENLVFLSCP